MRDSLMVVREIKDGEESVFFLSAESWTLHEFQMWMFGLTMDGNNTQSEQNEILAYYPDGVNFNRLPPDHPLKNHEHDYWKLGGSDAEA